MSSLYWKREEEELLCRLYATRTPAWMMAKQLGRSPGAIQTKAFRLGLTSKLPTRAMTLKNCEGQWRNKAAKCPEGERSAKERQRFKRLLMLLLWCKLKTGKSAKEVVSAVLQDSDRIRLSGASQADTEKKVTGDKSL
jgi:hypothetical protein